MKAFCGLLLFAFIHSAFAERVNVKITAPVKDIHYDLGVGSKVILEFVEKNQSREAIFLGRMVGHPDFGQEILFLNEKTNRVQMIDAESFSPSFIKMKLQNLISTIDQAGETCMAYAMFHYWVQTFAVGYEGNGQLGPVVTQERPRMKLLEESLTRYYMGRSFNLKPIMKDFGDRFGFKCKEKTFTDSIKAVDFVFNQSLSGKPVLIEFFLGQDMVESTYKLEDYETKIAIDDRLWTPRKVGQRMSSGHAIVAAAAFISKGKKHVLVLDSNWTEPRVWELDKYLGEKTAIDEVIFHACE